MHRKMRQFILQIIISVILIIACDETPDKTYVTFESVENYGTFGVTEKGTVVINTESEWLNLWQLYWNLLDGTGNKTPPPEINFEENMVVGVFWDTNCDYSGCSNESPSIKDIYILGDTLFVSVDELVDFGPCDACVLPLHLVQLEKLSFPVKFIGNVP